MPPPRAEEVEDSSGSDSADSASDSDAPVAVAPAAAAVVTVEAASARAAALAEQLAARTGTVPVEGTASPGRPKETAAPGADLAPLILEAEPIDLVVIGNAANCSSWIGKAIAESHFVAVVKTPVAPSTSVIVDAKIAEANIKPELLQRRWMALRVRRPMGDPRLPLRELSALCDQLVQAGVEPRTLVPIDSRSYLLLNKEHVHVSVTALVQCGHLVSPAQRVVNALPIPETSTELPEMQVGGWKLLQRQNDGITKDCRKNSIFQSILRVQAKCGFYCEVRTLDPQEVASEFHAQLSSFGMLRSDGSRSWRDPLVQFQVSDGSPLPLLHFTTEGAGEDVLLKETQKSSSGSAQGPVETWSKLPNSEKVTALELDANHDLQGIWMFAGKLFLRIIGVPRSQSLLASHCCRSLTQLEYFQGMETVQNELKKYEVLVGEVEESGVLRVHRNTWQGDTGPPSRLLLDARPTDLPKTGSVEVQLESGIVTHQDPDGKELRWRIREWGFDPFTVIEPVVSEPEAVSESGSSVSETVKVKQKKDAKAASKGAAPKAKAKAKAVAQSPKKEEKETDDEKEEKEVKKKKHKKKEKEKEKEEEKERSRKRASSESKSSSEVKKKKKKDKSRGRSERKDKKEKDKEKRKKKKGRSRTVSRSKGRKAARSRSRSRSKRRSRNRKTRRNQSSEHKKEEKKEVKEKQEKPVQERPSEDLSDREVRLKRFADQSKLIPQAMEALRNLKPDLQDKIMEEGPIKEGDGNPIIVLMKRIKEVAEWAQQEADRGEAQAPEKALALSAPEATPEANGGTVNGNGTEETEPATLPDQAILLRAFSIQNQLPDTAMEALKALPGDVLMNVLVRGPLETGDPMVALRKRIEEVR